MFYQYYFVSNQIKYDFVYTKCTYVLCCDIKVGALVPVSRLLFPRAEAPTQGAAGRIRHLIIVSNFIAIFTHYITPPWAS